VVGVVFKEVVDVDVGVVLVGSGPDASGSAHLKEAADIALMKPLWDSRDNSRIGE
jgi:hypothetical protein